MFFLPLFDDNPTKSRPLVSWFVIIACILVYLFQSGLSAREDYAFVVLYGVIPERLFSQFDVLTIISSMFLHGGFMHLGSNMLYLWIFGDNVEDAMGKGRFIVFYLCCGAAAALTQALIDPSSTVPLIGASGGIAGILGAYIMLYPRATIKVFMWIIIFVRLLNVPAWLVLGFWIGGQFMAAPAAISSQAGVAYFAHIGGFIAGMVLVGIFKRPQITLFAPAKEKTWQVARPHVLRGDIKRRYVLEKTGDSGSVPGFRRRRKGPWDEV